VDSSAIPVEFTSQIFTPAMEFCYSGIYTGTVPRMDWNRMALDAVTRMNTKNCQIWQVLHFQMKNSNKIKNRDGVVMLLRYCLHGLCAFPNMVSNANIARKSGKKREKK
jgi:hypothetical protein